MTYGFRLRLVLAPGRRIESRDDTLTLRSAGGSEFQLKPVDASVIADARSLAIRSSGYADEEAARATGQRVKDALLLASVTTNLGADLGRDRQTSSLAGHVREKIRKEHGVEMLGDVHGLAVFPEDRETRFFRAQATITVGTQADNLRKDFANHFEYATAVTVRHRISAELIALSHFETSIRARFLTLMTALEVLSERKHRGQQYQQAISILVQYAEGQKLLPEVLEALKNGLGNLRRQSLKAACVDKVAEHLGDEIGAKVSDLYDTRSQIVHEGAGISADELGSDLSELQKIVTATLISDLQSKSEGA
jgi:hypothetical protein